MDILSEKEFLQLERDHMEAVIENALYDYRRGVSIHKIMSSFEDARVQNND